jgi:hypothetical protein
VKPFRKHVALAIDGGGIKGVIVTRALMMLEEALGKPAHDIFRLSAGTSTGSIISVGLAAGLSAARMHDLYVNVGASIFPRSLRKLLFPLTRYRYPWEPLETALRATIGDLPVGDFWAAEPPTDLVLTTFDLVENRTRFIKPWKEEYKNWSCIQAILASSSVPTYFPVVAGRYVDGGVGSYANPCYLAAYEIRYVLNWDPAETTLISLGTGRDPARLKVGEADDFYAWNWIGPVLGAFLHSAEDQQVHLVKTFFEQLDFRRFQVDLQQSIEMDDPKSISRLEAYGEEMGRMILNDYTDRAMRTQISQPAGAKRL